MKSIAKAWNGLVSLFSQPYKNVLVEDLPKVPDRRTLYVVGEGPYRWFAAMVCPCGCGDLIKLNIRNDSHPYWRVIERRGAVSLDPSVWRTTGCRSHFFYTKNRIRWCRD